MKKSWVYVLLLTIMLAGCTSPATPDNNANIPTFSFATSPSAIISANPASTPSLPQSSPISPSTVTNYLPIPTTTGNLLFEDTGHTDLGDWSASAAVSPTAWKPGTSVEITTELKVSGNHMLSLKTKGLKVDGFCLLVTAERTFDSDGWLRLASDEKMSTLITPTRLAIEGGVQGAITNRFGTYDFRTPVDEFSTIPLPSPDPRGDWQASFKLQTKLPTDLPPGIYRLRLDYGVTAAKRFYSLNGEVFAYRPFFKGTPTQSSTYSPLIPASGNYVNGQYVDAAVLKPRVPWIILGNYNSNGYQGVVADEDQSRFAVSPRTIIPDDVILPLYASDYVTKLAYSLEPQFPADTIEGRPIIPWDYKSGQISVQVTGPDGKITDLGTAPFLDKAGQWPTTKNPAFTAWKPPAYGYYTVKVIGWVADIWGNKYYGGGTYHFWIAKRMTLATATFQGQPYPVGGRYGRDIGFSPALPADVEVTATLYINSDPNNKKTVTYSGKASPGGIFGAAQGMQPLILEAPGEYAAHILAKYSDQDKHLWICSMRHAGIVYAEDSPIVAHGKKLMVSGKLVDRGETKLEGWIESADVTHLQHINYPYQAGDMLLIASDQQGANKIEPVLTYELKDKHEPYDSRLQGIGLTNVKMKTSNGYSPHMFPEYITDMAYYYAGAPRPGFMSRFIVAENGTRAPYWPTSPNAFGGQINASNNGDLPGDIYRLIGGIALRNKGATPAYAGYMASAFLLPRGTNNNRILSAGAEDVLGSDQTKNRFFLVGLRPGMVYETGTAFTPAVQIDPMLPVNITFAMTYPDGRKVVAQGTADKFGTFAGKDKWTLDLPGIYRYTLEGEWQGFKGHMPGLPETGGEFYVIEKDRLQDATGLRLNLAEQSSFSPSGTLLISGTSTGTAVAYAAVIPGAVIAQGTLQVSGGKFSYTFDPVNINRLFPTYDIVNLVNGKPEIKDVVQFTFYSTENTGNGTVYHTFARVLIRGTTVIYAH